MRVDCEQEAGSGVSVTATPALDNPAAIIRVENLSKQVVSPEGPLVILDRDRFQHRQRGKRRGGRRIRFR